MESMINRDSGTVAPPENIFIVGYDIATKTEVLTSHLKMSGLLSVDICTTLTGSNFTFTKNLETEVKNLEIGRLAEKTK